MKRVRDKVGKNTLNEKKMMDELLYFRPKSFKFYVLILPTRQEEVIFWTLYIVINTFPCNLIIILLKK